MRKGAFIFLLAGALAVLSLLQGPGIVYGLGEPLKAAEKITFFLADTNHHGLWGYDPVTRQEVALDATIDEKYQFSADGRYLAFLVNNFDRVGQPTSSSLWVRDYAKGTEYAIDSDFDTNSNLVSTFVWLPDNALVTEKVANSGQRYLKVYKPTGAVLWEMPEEHHFLHQNNGWALLKSESGNAYYLTNVLDGRNRPLGDLGTLTSPQLSTLGNYITYTTYREVIVYNIEKAEKMYVAEVQTNGIAIIDYSWSPRENYFVYQTVKKSGNDETYRLTVFNVAKKRKEYEINSSARIAYVWSTDEKQLALGVKSTGWNLHIWLPEVQNLYTVQSAMAVCPEFAYRAETHELFFTNYLGSNHALFLYDVDRSNLSLLISLKPGLILQKPAWGPLSEFADRGAAVSLYLAGTGDVGKVNFIRSIEPPQTDSNPLVGTTSNLTQASLPWDTILKWAPGHRTLLYREGSKALSLIDQEGKVKSFYIGEKISEPFWNSAGSYIAYTSGSEKNELLLYYFYKDEVYKFPLQNAQLEPVQWIGENIWLYNGKLIKYAPLIDSWELVADWKSYWWNIPRIEPAHRTQVSLAEIGANLWLIDKAYHLKVLTRLTDGASSRDGVSGTNGLLWKGQSNSHPCWSPDDERILFERRLAQSNGGTTAQKSEIWLMDSTGREQRYLTDGTNARWLDNQRFIYVHDGDLYVANLITWQIIRLQTSDLTELACLPSYDNVLFAVVAKDKNEKIGLYYYDLKY